MAKVHTIAFGETPFQARSGERLLDAALASGVDFPHDCRAGRCGSCLTRVCSGATLGGETRTAGMVHACQAMVFSDLAIAIEPLPPVVRVTAKVMGITDIGQDIVEVVLGLPRPFDMRPGQYCRFRFRGYPPRPFSPTAGLGGPTGDPYLRLHIKRVRGGQVTPHLGHAIRERHSVTIEGPFGQAFLRPRQTNRLVAIGSGTGFAPVWSVVSAALAENSARPVLLVGVSRTAGAFYMGRSLNFAARFAGVRALGVIEDERAPMEPGAYNLGYPIQIGRAADTLPALDGGDVVYAAGGPALVDAIAAKAEAVGATFFADPFEPAAVPSQTWLESAKAWIGAA